LKKEVQYLYLPYENNLIKIPNKIGHSYLPLKILPLDELNTKYSNHKRLKVFHHKGLRCVRCPKEGFYLIEAIDKGGGVHVDIYTEDFQLMTVDHIKPRSIGGTFDIENLDPMCEKCNSKKSDKYEEELF